MATRKERMATYWRERRERQGRNSKLQNLIKAIELEGEFQMVQHAGEGVMYFRTRYQWFQVVKQRIPYSQARLGLWN